MIFIAYAHTSDSSIKSSMGAADYSYYFVLKRYIPVLKALGTLIQIAEPERELDEIVRIEKEELDIARLQPWQGSAAIIAADGLFNFGAAPLT